MKEVEQSNKVKILRELYNNGRTSLSELAEKTGLSRQTVAKTIKTLEKKKIIWGYSAIFDPKEIGLKQFVFLVKLDLSVKTDEFLKIITNPKLLKENEEKFGFRTSFYCNGNKDIIALIWAKDIIEAKKLLNAYKKILGSNIKDIDLLEIITTFRNNGISNPDIAGEWKKLLISPFHAINCMVFPQPWGNKTPSAF